MAEKLEMMSSNIIQENIDYIASKFPNALKEVMENGKLVKKIDFDILKQELSAILIDDRQERYQMTWPDKKKSILLANSRINATLRPIKEKSVDFDNTKNLYIEGDNLDVLKLLRETYLGKIKMIYIDPPYNTGNDFVYEDDFSQSSEDYLGRSGQYDEQGNRLFQNTESNGRFHTDWLNMMYPRLKIAKDLLRDDGIIFISIDDNEYSNLEKMCDEIFGVQNYIATMIWKSKSGGANDVNSIATDTEFILAYSKNVSEVEMYLDPDAEVTTSYNLVDSDGRRYSLDRLDKQSLGYHETLDFPILGSDGRIYTVQHKKPDNKVARWRWSESTVKERYNELVFKWPYVYTKNYEKTEGSIPRNLLIDERFGRTRTGKTELADLFDGIAYFDFPKPTKLIKYLAKISTKYDDIILDFFSGSATTAHATIDLNIEDNQSRRFILIQLPESTDVKSKAYQDNYPTICDIGEERIRRVGRRILEKNTIFGNQIDIGFRVLKLDSSNMNDVYYNPNNLSQNLLDQLVGNVKEDRTALDLLFQVMLELGIELSAKIEEKELNGKTYFVVNENDIVACFDNGIDDNLTKELAKIKPIYAVFKDSSFTTDSANINCEQIFKSISPSTTIKVI